VKYVNGPFIVIDTKDRFLGQLPSIAKSGLKKIMPIVGVDKFGKTTYTGTEFFGTFTILTRNT
tara:strand:+ start:2679 stop:2867 length:189 start_codon:yes stop_codon:yes gene_type:complete